MENKEFKLQLIGRAKLFSLNIWKLLDSLSSNGFSFVIVAKQLFRSATSIGANIIEAQASSSRKDFINFLHHALKSSNETKYWLELLLEKHNSIQIQSLLQEADELSKILGSVIIKLKGRK